jgi:two-component system chemotaxis response regulator CheV
MAGLIDSIDQRTRLAGQNRLELLLFRLKGRQRFAINVFKVQEVIPCPRLRQMPDAHPVIRGIAYLRGRTIPVMDLSQAIGRSPVEDVSKAYLIITEFNRHVQGFMVTAVEHIVNMKWENIQPPPKTSGQANYLTAVTSIDGDMVSIIDVEKVLSEVIGDNHTLSESVRETAADTNDTEVHKRILVVDDSSVARKQMSRTLVELGIQCELARDGREALTLLKKQAELGPISDYFSMIISDVEMPEMDGYTLTAEIRRDPVLRDMYIILHTSLSGIFNESIVKKVGADQFIPKFSAEDLATAVLGRLNVK